MSTLTSLVKNGKRKIMKAMSNQLALEHEQENLEARQQLQQISGSSAPIQSPLWRPDQQASHDVTRPQRDVPNPFGESALGRTDQQASHDVTRPQRDVPNPFGESALGQPDLEATHDVTRP